VIAAPPFDGATQVIVIPVVEIVEVLGADICEGTVRGKVLDTAVEVAPDALYESTYTSYVVPFVKPVIV
jgi:hypothetical protein